MTLGSLSVERNASSSSSPSLLSPKDVLMPLRSPRTHFSISSKKMAKNSHVHDGAVLDRSLSFKNWETENAVPAPPAPSRCVAGGRPGKLAVLSPKSRGTTSTIASPSLAQGGAVLEFLSPRPRSELDEAATKVQKVFKGHRTRRSLADCAIVIEELWWKLYDSACLDLKSISFFQEEKPETAASRWARAGKRIAKVGKGLSKDDKAQKLALQHWLEAIDPRHRYGHNLHLYYDIWFASSSTEPFFYWLDIGAGRDIHHPKCPRSKLHSQLIMYLATNERAAYEVIVQEGKLMYRQSRVLVNTTDDSKWIFVLSTARSLYVGQKKKGKFQHSSFLAGGATTAAGRLVAKEGHLKAIWPYSGHYLPTEENFKEFISFLEENNVDLTNVKRCSVDDDELLSFKKTSPEPSEEANEATKVTQDESLANFAEPEVDIVKEAVVDDGGDVVTEAAPELASRASLKWTTGAGARIGCVRDYPVDLQCMALEHVNLSPRVAPSPTVGIMPIPSPRPSPRFRLSPRLQYMGIPTPTGCKIPINPSPTVRRSPRQQCMGIPAPTVHLTLPKHKGK